MLHGFWFSSYSCDRWLRFPSITSHSRNIWLHVMWYFVISGSSSIPVSLVHMFQIRSVHLLSLVWGRTTIRCVWSEGEVFVGSLAHTVTCTCTLIPLHAICPPMTLHTLQVYSLTSFGALSNMAMVVSVIHQEVIVPAGAHTYFKLQCVGVSGLCRGIYVTWLLVFLL